MSYLKWFKLFSLFWSHWVFVQTICVILVFDWYRRPERKLTGSTGHQYLAVIIEPNQVYSKHILLCTHLQALSLLLSSAQFTCATTPSRSTSSHLVTAILVFLRTTCGPAPSSGVFCSSRAGLQTGPQWWSRACSKQSSMPCKQLKIWLSLADRALSSMELTSC